MSEKNLGALMITRQTTQESVVNQLRNLILTRRLKPGDRLVQSELAQEFGVSRTPIREALHNLASEGLISLSAYKGATVADFSLPELEGIYSVRIALEGYAAYLAAKYITKEELREMETLLRQTEQALHQQDHSLMLKLNREFHAILYNASGQQRLYETILNHLDLSDMYRRLYFTVEKMYANTIQEHEELLDILWRRDAERAEQHTRYHLRQTASALIQFFEHN